MKAIMVMFDSLNRRMLPPYGCAWVHAPNFSRLAQRTVTFDRAYVGSMPCMPARREIHTGRYNFLHRSWGPLEPFDDSMPAILSAHGVYSHLVSDHYHYWEEGGCNYHTRYASWEISRGQEGDAWKGDVRSPDIPETRNGGNTGNGGLLAAKEKSLMAIGVGITILIVTYLVIRQGIVNKRQNSIEKITFLSNILIYGMIGIPRHLFKCRRNTDSFMAIVQI
jgi:hypothetical protein